LKVSPASISLETKRIPWSGKRQISVVYGSPPDKNPSDSTAVVIAHGARKSMSSPLITFFHVEMARRGFFTIKFNFPYMEARFRLTRTPDPKEVLVGCYRKVLDEVVSRQRPEKLVIGGLSMGAAVASHVAADKPGRSDVGGLYYLSYPIHRPGRPEELGVKHLSQISKPMMFISGTRDPNARPEQMEDLVSKLGPKARLHTVEGADRSFNPRKGRAIYFKRLDHIATVLEDWIKTQVNH
jgi:predicted alpha/beta-hydrolase family hydrolase